MANDEIAVIAIIIINIGETILAETAASPKTRAPTIPTVEPREPVEKDRKEDNEDKKEKKDNNGEETNGSEA